MRGKAQRDGRLLMHRNSGPIFRRLWITCRVIADVTILVRTLVCGAVSTSHTVLDFTLINANDTPISILTFRPIFKRHVSCKIVGGRSSLSGCALANHYHLLQFVNF